MVVVTTGGNILEMATRARTELFLLLAEPEKEEFKKSCRKFPVVIKAAEDEGLVDVQVIESIERMKMKMYQRKMEDINSNLDDKSVRLLYTKTNKIHRGMPQKMSISGIGAQKP